MPRSRKDEVIEEVGSPASLSPRAIAQAARQSQIAHEDRLLHDGIRPTVVTERLRLRPHSLADLADRAALVGDEQVMRHVGGGQDPEENWTRLLRYAGHWALRGHGLFAVEEKESGRLAGEVGLAGFHRGLGPDFDEAPEGAWVLAGWAHGRGYATEAMRAAITWHETHIARERMVCVIARDNAASLRVARKLGFRIFGERDYRGANRLVLERAAR